MNKTVLKSLFKAIESDDANTVESILDADPDALESVGQHNPLVRDKTPLMYAMQCRNFRLANALLDRGANAAAVMPAGPGASALALCLQFAYSDSAAFSRWVRLATRLLDDGADPNTGMWAALHGYGRVARRVELIRLMLDRGADPDRRVGNTSSTVRELVAHNRERYPAEVLAWFHS